MNSNWLPLKNNIVVEIGRVVAAPTCALILGALGADVIKIEAPTSDERTFTDTAPSIFTALNRNKRSLALDLKTREGKNIFYKLIQRSDVIIENLGPGAMDRLGFSYEELHKLNPKIIYCSIKGFGPGPYHEKLAYDVSIQGQSGLMYMTGLEGKPLRIGASVVDMTCAVFGALGIILALRQRDITGKGKFIQSDLFETAVFFMSYAIAEVYQKRRPPQPLNTPGLWFPIYDVFNTADGKKVFVGVTSDSQWQRLCEEFDLQELLYKKRFSTTRKRLEQRRYIIPLVTDVFSKFSAEQLCEKLENCKVVFSPINNPMNLINDPHLKTTGKLLETTIVGSSKTVKLPTIPPLIEGHTEQIELPAPELGEHTAKVLQELGYDQKSIKRLVEAGIVKLRT